MGKKANRQRNIGKYFCVNELENQIIEKRMQEANLTNFGEFARKSCLDKKIYMVDFSSLKEIMSTIAQANLEVNRIGNNLNQIAKYLNESEQNQTRELLNEYQKEIQSLDQKLRNMLKKITEG
ncbi:plasmid mobilization relaxosome protein MobC [Enterococcus faecalis]|uniref:plasmid mobilization protein n=1 Tax=Enterococcus faecalis TaxID=1351 RepID=UPI00114505A1|nr:plasmid mobilization relaxosome protein MobC [Enterococcus faecalis]NSV47100.1 plasmid mobilization relaxosome protein MobC [Enterococcus faecalis]TQA41339.1 MobC family plasmid mobilization relaxosome protein [Enterococcus faecalis]